MAEDRHRDRNADPQRLCDQPEERGQPYLSRVGSSTYKKPWRTEERRLQDEVDRYTAHHLDG